MTYYTISPDGKIYKGKANNWNDVSLNYGDRLYNPYTKQTVVGWNFYKWSMKKSYDERFGSKKTYYGK